jgi:hypothetical protein
VGKNGKYFLDVGQRVDVFAVVGNTKVQVRTGGKAGGTNVTNGIWVMCMTLR